ncbi:MAG: CZB domain-containing protein [Thermodesulfovibrionales bacterium]|nr:CZB domain-containing protein [Thermodesulfovibrionales bacterium]
MSGTDFTDIRLKHVTWRVKLDDFFDGKPGMTGEEATSHKACDMGKWLYAEGMKKYGTMPEMQELEKKHVELHATVKNIMTLKQSANISAEKEEREKLDKILRKVMFLLVDIEQKFITQHINDELS